jgi:SAM-dependent methyltransferase
MNGSVAKGERRGALPDLMPPSDLHCGEGPDFVEKGEKWVVYFTDVCGLKPDERVLDVGCGSGRVALPLSRYMTEGRYDGFDTGAREIEWCQKHVTPVAPNFHFEHANVYNKTYNPAGTIAPGEFRFPYGDQEFDFVLLTSVFTHMLPADLEHYFSEISRVLKSDGRWLATYFLLNDEALQMIVAGTSFYDFTHDLGDYRVFNPDQHEDGIAYPESYVRKLYERFGYDFTIDYGGWPGRGPSPTNKDGQDIVVARARSG